MSRKKKDFSEADIISHLQASGLRIKNHSPGGTHIQAYCYKGHDNKSASLYIRKADGIYYCHGCGVKGHDWHTLIDAIGGKPIKEENLPDPFARLRVKMDGQIDDSGSVTMPWDLQPWKGKYRDVSQYTMDAVGAYKWFDDQWECYRVLLPVLVEDELRAWISRSLDNDVEMKHKNNPDCKIKPLLYPLHVVDQMNTNVVVLVEGPYDALRLLDMDIPALAILGSNNYEDSNRILLLNLGITKVIVLMDGDNAGRKARKVLVPSLKEFFQVKQVYCPEEKDPGKMPDERYKKLYRLTH